MATISAWPMSQPVRDLPEVGRSAVAGVREAWEGSSAEVIEQARGGVARVLRLAGLRRALVLLALAAVAAAAYSLLSPSAGSAAPSVGAPSESAASRVWQVRPGDTLWGIAERVAPDADPRATIQAIRAENGSQLDTLEIGQDVILPSGL